MTGTKACITGVNVMWGIFELVAHEFHSIVAGKGTPDEVQGKYAWQNETPTKVGFAADATSVELRQAARRKRQLQHLRALQGSSSVVAGQARADITRALLKQGGEPFCSKLRAAWCVGDYEVLVEQARKDEDRVLESHRVKSKQQWFAWTKDGWEKDKRSIYKWIRDGIPAYALRGADGGAGWRVAHWETRAGAKGGRRLVEPVEGAGAKHGGC